MCLSSSLFSGRQVSKIVYVGLESSLSKNQVLFNQERMLTSPVAQLISRWTSDLKVGGSRPVQDTSKINPIFAGFRWLSS